MSSYNGVAALCAHPSQARLLMILQGMPGQPPTWMLPGGPLKDGEKSEQAVARETLEDTGLKVKVKRRYKQQSGTAQDVKKRDYKFTCDYYEVEAPGTALKPQDPDERIYLADWVAREQIESLGLYYEFQREVIRKFFDEVVARAA